VSRLHGVKLGCPTLLEFRGPDAVRFLNGQLTQDVRLLAGGEISLPSCVTDAKGKLQFRITLTADPTDALWITLPADQATGLEARLTRYLIADDVEVSDLTSHFELYHWLGAVTQIPAGVISRRSDRYGITGTDWWVPAGQEISAEMSFLTSDELETLRITHGVPVWGRELHEGLLPPEALLDQTDVSYHKGCYVGQEVISRLKSAGKVNKRLTQFLFPVEIPVVPGLLENGAGEITSIAPTAKDGLRPALGYVKRNAGELFLKGADGVIYPVPTTCGLPPTHSAPP
jgi:tRNA-modifying protein YgfZ